MFLFYYKVRAGFTLRSLSNRPAYLESDEPHAREQNHGECQLRCTASIAGVGWFRTRIGRADDIAEAGWILDRLRIEVLYLGRGGVNEGGGRGARDTQRDGDQKRSCKTTHPLTVLTVLAILAGVGHTSPVDHHPEILSPSVRRVLDLPRPEWRGRMHKWAIPVAIAAAIWLVLVADPGVSRATAAIFGVASTLLYVVSATVHHKIWSPERLHLLFQLDHSMIMVFIAAATSPVALAAVGGRNGWLLFIGMLTMVGIGLIAIWLPFHPPRGFMNTLFFLVSWWPILFALPLGRALGAWGIALLIVAGAVYTIGALIVGFQRPDPDPLVFGYHEIWHIFVILGNIIVYVLVWMIVTGLTPA